MIYALLFLEFFKTGLLSVGGGLATLPFLTEMSARHPEWFSLEELANMVAVGESTPGPIGVNTATYVGFTTAGIGGGVLATLALVLPSFIIVYLISKGLKKYSENKFVNRAFYALRAAVVGLIAAAGFSVLKMAVFSETPSSFADIFSAFDWRCGVLFAVVLAATQIKKLKNLHPLVFIGAGAAAGIFLLG